MSGGTDGRARTKSAAGCMILSRRTGRFLFCRRPDDASAGGRWSLWGGKKEDGESPSQTAKREVEEETGFKFDSYPDHIHRMTTPGFRYDTFLMVVDDEFMPKSTPESDGYAWAPLEGVPKPMHWGLEKLLHSSKATAILWKTVERESGRPSRETQKTRGNAGRRARSRKKNCESLK